MKTKILVLILLISITSPLVVAFGIALIRPNVSVSSTDYTDADLSSIWRHMHGTGIECVDIILPSQDFTQVQDNYTSMLVSRRVPDWTHLQIYARDQSFAFGVGEVRFGWPMKCVSYIFSRSAGSAFITYGISIRDSQGSILNYNPLSPFPAAIPLRICTWPFLINFIVVFIFLVGLRCVAYAARQMQRRLRMRRGFCPICNYLLTDEMRLCPECGHTVGTENLIGSQIMQPSDTGGEALPPSAPK